MNNSCTEGNDTRDDFERGKDEELAGLIAFMAFADGAIPFVGRKQPKNPHHRGTCEHIGWQFGYDDALTAWFA